MQNSENLHLEMYAKNRLNERIAFILQLVQHEHEKATTHSQRNAYQHVIRVELESLQHVIQYSRVTDSDDESAVPF